MRIGVLCLVHRFDGQGPLFMTAIEAPTLGVVSQPNRAFACLPAIEASATQVLRVPMQENADASGSLQSEDVSTPVVLSLPYVERLKPLAEYWTAWSCLPNVSQWGPPPFSGVLPTTVHPWKALILSQEIVSLLEKSAIEEIPPTQMESGFRVNKFEVLTVKSILSHIQSADWFVTIDLKHAYFHIQIVKRHRKFEGKAYQYGFLPFGLALPPRTFTKIRLWYIPILAGLWRLGARSPEEPRVTDEPTKECPAAVSANDLLGGGPRLVHNAGTSLGVRAVHVPGHLNSGPDLLSRQSLEAGEWRLHPHVVNLIWQRFGRAEVELFASSMTTHCPLWFSLSPPSPLVVLFRVRSDRVERLLLAPRWPTQPWFSEPGQSASRPSLGGSSQTRSADSSPWHDLASSTGIMEVVGVAPERSALMRSCLSAEITDTIINSRAPSTRRLYALKWRLFTSWYRRHNLDPVHCPIGSVLEILQSRFSEGITPATLKVYVAAISAEHAPTEGVSFGRDDQMKHPPWVSRFMQGLRRLRPFRFAQVPSWDLSIVLEGLAGHPFEL
ncbi:hypothetical protein H4Q32_007859 [Labeo rohita]|uniref:Reverse transcriptase domain-containing protein n=1 Tax=Labeo rohita TaxID=84645 RepID=A0ABQ8MBQ9_LABRO|nr:hypothetical protein H4Q32_007859 [Labeo rohita]